MKRSSFLFFKGLGLLFAILCGIGTAFLGWYDGADWMNIATYSIAVTGLILWGWYHFSVRWINEDLKKKFSSFSSSFCFSSLGNLVKIFCFRSSSIHLTQK